MSKAYLVNKLKYTVRNLPESANLAGVRTLNDWVEFQSRLLGYASAAENAKDCDPVHYLKLINVPALFISVLDDNIFHDDITLQFTDLPAHNPNITMITTQHGGHVKFKDEGTTSHGFSE